jgi:hypothetical protein
MRCKNGTFLSKFDCSSVKTEGQHCTMVATRFGISEEQAKRDVDAWMEGKQFRAVSSISEPK